MAIKIGAWNTENRLSPIADEGRGTPEQILRGIRDMDLDVLVLPEAFHNEPAPGVDEALRELKYDWRDVEYSDLGREEAHAGALPHMRVLSRLAIEHSEEVRFGGVRNMLVVEVDDPHTKKRKRIMPIHWRDDAESKRVAQARDAVTYQRNHPDMPTIALGDFNALHRRDRRARLLSNAVLRHTVGFLPGPRLQYLGKSLTDFGKGEALAIVEQELGMIDLDKARQPTMTFKSHDISERLPSFPLLQLDHIFVSRGAFTSTGVTVWPDGGADHRAVTTTVHEIHDS